MLGVNTPANVPSVPLVSEVPDLLFGIETADFIINLDIAAKRHKIHKKIIYILEYQIVMGVKNINLDFLQDHQSWVKLRLCRGTPRV